MCCTGRIRFPSVGQPWGRLSLGLTNGFLRLWFGLRFGQQVNTRHLSKGAHVQFVTDALLHRRGGGGVGYVGASMRGRTMGHTQKKEVQ